MNHVVVMGAGVIGLTTAYYLAKNGHRVTVLDSADELASGASAGNGGQLSYSFTDAMASPALLTKMPRIALGMDPAFYVRQPINTQLLMWGLSFMRQCTRTNHRDNTTAILKIALRSAGLMKELQSELSLDFNFCRAGKLVMLTDTEAMQAAESLCELKRSHGCDVVVVPYEQAIEIEPAIKLMGRAYAGAVYSKYDELGDSQLFTRKLGEWLKDNRGVEFRLDTRVNDVDAKDNQLRGIQTSQGFLETDMAVVCLGAWSGQLLEPHGIKARIYPVRGYSVTLPATPGSNRVSITDPGAKIVFTRLGEQVRIAGFADFVDYHTGKDDRRIQVLLKTAQEVAPEIADYEYEMNQAWGGFRPLTPNSRPLVGPSRVKGLHLNTGHGTLGWTLACATGHDIAATLTS